MYAYTRTSSLSVNGKERICLLYIELLSFSIQHHRANELYSVKSVGKDILFLHVSSFSIFVAFCDF